MSTKKGESFIFHIISMKDDKCATFQLLATKGDDKVVTTSLVDSMEYGTHNALPLYIQVI